MQLDPAFFAVAIPAVVIAGLSKGGFGASAGFASTPLLALVMPPAQAAALAYAQTNVDTNFMTLTQDDWDAADPEVAVLRRKVREHLAVFDEAHGH